MPCLLQCLYVAIGEILKEDGYQSQLKHLYCEVVMAESLEKWLLRGMAQGKVDIDFQGSTDWHQDGQLIHYEGSECYQSYLECRLDKAVSSVGYQGSQWPYESMFCEKQRYLEIANIFQMREKKASQSSNPPSRPQTMKSPHEQGAIISSLQQEQQHKQSYMARIQQKEPSLRDYLIISSIYKAGTSKAEHHSFKNIDILFLYFGTLIHQTITPSVEQIKHRQGYKYAYRVVIICRYLFEASLSSKVSRSFLGNPLDKVLIQYFHQIIYFNNSSNYSLKQILSMLAQSIFLIYYQVKFV